MQVAYSCSSENKMGRRHAALLLSFPPITRSRAFSAPCNVHVVATRRAPGGVSMRPAPHTSVKLSTSHHPIPTPPICKHLQCRNKPSNSTHTVRRVDTTERHRTSSASYVLASTQAGVESESMIIAGCSPHIKQSTVPLQHVPMPPS
jgi:hypothetical protein